MSMICSSFQHVKITKEDIIEQELFFFFNECPFILGKKGRERKRKKLDKEERKETSSSSDSKGLESSSETPDQQENKERQQQQQKRRARDKQQKSVSVSTVHQRVLRGYCRLMMLLSQPDVQDRCSSHQNHKWTTHQLPLCLNNIPNSCYILHTNIVNSKEPNVQRRDTFRWLSYVLLCIFKR